MAEKSFFEIFSKYQPDAADAAWLGKAKNITLRADKEKRIIEIRAAFDELIKKATLYRVEAEIAKAYQLSLVRILPQYPAACFGEPYIAEVLEETQRIGVVARGFFHSYRATLDADSLKIELPYLDESLLLMELGKTHEVIAGIIRSEFGLTYRVEICHAEDLAANYSYGGGSEALAALDAQLRRSSAEYDRARSERPVGGEQSATVPEAPKGERVMSLLGEVETPVVENGICRIGAFVFDVSEPVVAVGSAFEIRPKAIAHITHPERGIVVIGEVFGYTEDTTRDGTKFNISFGLTDGNSSIMVKKFGMSAEDKAALTAVVKDGAAVALRGYAKHDTHKEVVDIDVTFYYTDVMAIKRQGRADNAPQKRVELHLHTTMSAMDALIPPDVAVKQANKWGHPAVALTDHGNVQAYQEAMLVAEKLGQKVIYGMEAYFVNDTASALYGNYKGTFEDEFVVFDIETTGLSNRSCGITEIGAVKVKNGAVLERYGTFVNPEMPIPADVSELTGITDDMVKDARPIAEVLPEFFAFVGDRLLIAHNADFDIGFIRVAAKKCGLPFENAYLDTLALSRYLNTDLKTHKLDVLANYFGLGDFNHHRAKDDAEMLAMIYFKMQEKLQAAEIRNFSDLQNEMSAAADPLRLPTYHQILLVKNKTGLKNLYKLVSYGYLDYYRKVPRVPKTVLEKHREGLIVGSACVSGELMRAILDNKPESEIEEIAKFYDFLEIQPICNNQFLVAEGKIADEEGLRDLDRRVVALGEKLGIPVVATCDAHVLNPEDAIFREVLTSIKKFEDGNTPLYYRTTEEMLEEFAYLGEKKAFEVVVENTNLIADMVEADIRPFPKGTFTPNMDGAEEDLQRICYDRAKSMYGDPLPEIVEKRLDKELTSIIKNGFAVLYMIAQKLVWYSESQGYLVGSRGSVGSSFVASMAGISEVNPLPPHYWCPKCQHNEFDVPAGIGSGFDLPDKSCPVCGTKMNNDGHNIPFETFLGFYGDKSPDIDLNFSGEVQGRVHKYTEELFGAENVFRAGTIGGIADKTAFGFVLKYMEEKGISLPRAEMNRLAAHCVGVKRSTGQHPGGIVVVPKEYEIYDFCPVQHPADDPNSDIVTTHFTFEYLHDTLLKLDELGHDIPTKYKWIERFSDTSVMQVPMNDASVYELFLSTKPLGVSPEDIDAQLGTYGLPEFGTRFVMKMVEEAKPRSFADLLQISGLSHGTDVWVGNAQDLIKNGICDISHVIGCRDNIMNDLIRYGLENAHAFKIMEAVRKGKGLTPEWEAEMREHSVPEWYIDSCKKIKYMFPKAHAAAYVMSAIRLGWYKVHMPLAFYAAMFTVAPGGFDAEIVMGGKSNVVATIKDIERRGKEASPKEQASISTLQLINEAMARHIRFLPVSLEKSDSRAFLPENGAIRMPFSALGGVGENAAESIVAARNEEPFFSIEDLQIRAGLNKSVVETLRQAGVLDGINETDQLSFF
ncbi:MAG: PolC-type DNA polymerase III [Ruminococcaceae bacterium]|nr:PolC-type DNA polymerase III [Oscillospiraceae bacterium]